ncbi:hypothetical protein ABR33_00155 [Enterobacter bugandensis]|uniref:hypothetical protein n=1 Tax=Enterobacter bugandensis TaxID=881260 RepID=UPI000643E413|nr:hypothetical protein [Enterobacter bugandensis]KLQ40431.1 hypothetical protein ABR33_00155 [Enterobacter bugandensis]
MAHYLARVRVMVNGLEHVEREVVQAVDYEAAEQKVDALLRGGWFTHDTFSWFDSDTNWYNFQGENEAARIESIDGIPTEDALVLQKYI